ncbi:MAG: cyclic nucleotide-binding/CBS domain-containing protein [Sphingomonadales bacterium]|nr:cyclic nucleotide-binding/CBS domain-containing protein [Sphingomonadales bacterium]MBD3773417.1 cyclic nucleotide-binding/CBS domain-containing protein [Paracoccaceae bacterium]
MTLGESELREVCGFLERTEPFPSLDRGQLNLACRAVEVAYFRRGSTITAAGDANRHLSIIRAGAVELRLGGTDLHARLGEGDCFGYPSLIRNGTAQNEAIAVEDCLLYRIDAAAFARLRQESDGFRRFFEIDEASRLRRAVSAMREAGAAAAEAQGAFTIHAPVETLLAMREIVTAPPEMPIGTAAELMAREDVSTLPVCEGERIVGIITDKDLRRRVLAVGLDLATPVSSVMTPDPLTVPLSEPLASALLTMTGMHIHHLPVLDAAGRLRGIVSAGDILAQLGSNWLHVVREIEGAGDPQAIARATSQLPRAVGGLVGAGVDADHVARYVSTVAEVAHRRLLALAQAELGPPPARFALVAFGSLARSEVALGSDQDNGFVFAEDFDRERHDGYFAELGRRLSDGLNTAGFRYCPGDIMASNPAYRRTVEEWQAHFSGWIDKPDPQAVLESGIFFDMRGVAGEIALVEAMRERIFEAARRNRIFLSFIARSAAATAVPLGFFRNFLLKEDAVEGKVLDLKAQAIAPIVDLARSHAIAGGIAATGTIDRLAAAAKAGSLDKEAARDLAACFEFVRDVRFRHQAEQVARGDPPSNLLDPGDLSRFDREHLRDAFKLIRAQLDKLRSDFAGGMG